MKEKRLSTLFIRICVIAVALLFTVIFTTPTPAKTINLRVYYHGAPRGGASFVLSGLD